MIVAGALAVTAVATGNEDDADASAQPTAAPSTSLSSAPAPTTASPSAAATTASPTASPSVSPTATPTVAGGAPTVTATPTGSTPATPTGKPGTSLTAVPTTPSAGPTKTTGSAPGPHVSSVAVTGFQCSTGNRTATATVFVQYDGAAAGTLHLTWWRSANGKPQGAVKMAPQTATFPKGATSYTFTDKLTYAADQKHPYVGLTVSTDPGADSGNGSYGVGCH